MGVKTAGAEIRARIRFGLLALDDEGVERHDGVGFVDELGDEWGGWIVDLVGELNLRSGDVGAVEYI